MSTLFHPRFLPLSPTLITLIDGDAAKLPLCQGYQFINIHICLKLISHE